MSLAPTAEQSHILTTTLASSANLMINALAGTGKTTTLELIAEVCPTKPVLYLAFNRRIADHAAKRFPTTTTVRTFNSLGHRVWSSACASNLKLNPKKTQDILREIINEAPKSTVGVLWDSFWDVVQAVGFAKSIGYIPDKKFPHANHLASKAVLEASLEEHPDDLTLELIDEVLHRSIQQAYAGIIDYNDQIYMPALFGGTFPRFPLVKVDEYQDLNPVNHAMLDKLVRGRIIGVGDPWQSIYHFRGACQDGMGKAQARFAMTSLDLSISFRCPQAIVENARWRVPHFKWSKPGGTVDRLPSLDADDIRDNSAIICRNNAPLFKLALNLLARGRSVSVAGSDIGPKLIGLMRKLGPPDLPRDALLDAIALWRAERLAKASTTATDLADCMVVFAGFGTNLSTTISYAEHLFKQQGSIKLLTGHKAKGLEWPTVYHLDPCLIGKSEQDLNLRYVIQTRAQEEYFEINSSDIT